MTNPLAPLLPLFPLMLPRVHLLLLEQPVDQGLTTPDVFGTVQVVYFDGDGQVTNIMEQTLHLAPHPNVLLPPERAAAAVEAHKVVLTELFTGLPNLDYLMPHDLIHLGSILLLRKSNTVEDFVKALRAHKRLGRWLADIPA